MFLRGLNGSGARGGLLIRGGLALGALTGILVAVAPGSALVEGPAREGGGTYSAGVDAFVAGVGIAGIVLIGACAALPWLWAHLAGLALTSLLAQTAGVAVVQARISDSFVKDADLTLETGGRLLSLAFWLGMVAVVIALVGIRRLVLEDRGEAPEPIEPESVEPERRPILGGASGKATLALVLGVVGFLILAAAPLAVATASMALGDIRRSPVPVGGRSTAIVGLVLGIVAMSLAMVIFGFGSLNATPR